MIKSRIICILVFFLPAISNAGNNSLSKHTVSIKNCPSSLQLTIPSYFTKAKTQKAIELRSSILAALNKPYNEQPYSKAKAHYSEVYKTNWNYSWPPFPRIRISSLGSVQKAQGNISESTWNSIKHATINVDKTEQQRRYSKIVDYYKRHGANVTSQWLKPYEANKNTIVLKAIGKMEIPNDNKVLNYIGATKMVYTKKCVAAVSVYVDLKTPEPYKKLKSYINQINVK